VILRAFFEVVLGKRLVLSWFFVVSLWWIHGGVVVFGWLFLSSSKPAALSNFSVDVFLEAGVGGRAS
jgi:hypothetical protein